VPSEECGGLISYGPDSDLTLTGAAGYVDRILKCEKPADLPVVQSSRRGVLVFLNGYRVVLNRLSGQSPISAHARRGHNI